MAFKGLKQSQGKEMASEMDFTIEVVPMGAKRQPLGPITQVKMSIA